MTLVRRDLPSSTKVKASTRKKLRGCAPVIEASMAMDGTNVMIDNGINMQLRPSPRTPRCSMIPRSILRSTLPLRLTSLSSGMRMTPLRLHLPGLPSWPAGRRIGMKKACLLGGLVATPEATNSFLLRSLPRGLSQEAVPRKSGCLSCRPPFLFALEASQSRTLLPR